jgi:hypothetical protein
MATETYIVKADQLQNLRNREVVEAGLLEGRIIPPVLEDISKGEEVQLDADADQTKTLLELGAIAEKGGGGLSSLKKGELEDLAAEHGVDLSDASNNEERVAALEAAGVTAEPSE